MTDTTSLGDRMKSYEEVPRTQLTPRMPMILRVDGRAFHTYVKRLHQPDTGAPWNPVVRDAMTDVARALMREITGAKIAYLQSDEVSVLVTDYDKPGSQAWFDKVAQKVCSVGASVATLAFNTNIRQYADMGMPAEIFPATATFDARAFCIPQDDVCNYFIWRQQDATRNSVSMLAQHHFDHRELQGKSWGQMQEMLFRQRDVNWDACDTWKKRGWCVTRQRVHTTVGEMRAAGHRIDAPPEVQVADSVGVVRQAIDPDWDIPVFTKDHWYIHQHVDLEAADRLRRAQEIMSQICGPGWEEEDEPPPVPVSPAFLHQALLGRVEDDE